MYLNLEVLHPQILQSLPKVLLLLGVLLNLNLLLEVLRNPNPLLVASQLLKVLLLALEVQVQVLLQTQNLPSRLSLLIYSRLEEVIVELRVRIPNRVHNPVFSNSAEHQVQTLPPLQLLDLLHQQVIPFFSFTNHKSPKPQIIFSLSINPFLFLQSHFSISSD